MSAKDILGFFTREVESVTIPLAEYEELQAKVRYYQNKVRQLEQRPFLEEKGRNPQGEITWGTPANGMSTVDGEG